MRCTDPCSSVAIGVVGPNASRSGGERLHRLARDYACQTVE